MRKVIVNTTPLIALCHIGQLDVLKKMYDEITIPRAVYKELSEKKESICKKQVDASLDWIHVEEIENHMAKSMFKTQLHDGEVEVMVLAKERNADIVIIDDANAKKYAKYLQLPVTGTLGVLIKAKKQGYIHELKPMIQGMINKNIYISERVMRFCLEQVDEEI